MFVPVLLVIMITAVVMVGEDHQGADPRSWVQAARRVAARDRIKSLSQQPSISSIVVVSPTLDGLTDDVAVDFLPSPVGPVHVGHYLSKVSQRHHADRLLYFGGGSAPLLTDSELSEVTDWLVEHDSGIITNNKHSSDWAGIIKPSVLEHWQGRLPKDNMLGWVLSAEAGLPAKDFAPKASTRLDIDTPTDLQVLHLHAHTQLNLRKFLNDLALDTCRLEAFLEVLKKPASQAFISGRLSPESWRRLNQVTQSWIRVISEERGMISSGRQSRNEVYSLLADYIDHVGLSNFFAKLATQVQGALIDTRVLLAHHKRWPSDSDRFSSDLGLVDRIQDDWLREFTAAAVETPIPVILGGHGLLSGDLFALCDLL